MASNKKKIKFGVADRFRAVVSRDGGKWSLEWRNDHNQWTRMVKGKISDDDPQFVQLKESLAVDTPDEALKLSIGIQRARASLPK